MRPGAFRCLAGRAGDDSPVPDSQLFDLPAATAGRSHYLFSYFEYGGNDFKADTAAMAADPTTRAWWKLCKPLQEPLPDRVEGEWWAGAEEVFHCA